MIIAAYAFLYLLIGFLVACLVMKGEDEDQSVWFILIWLLWPLHIAASALAFTIRKINQFADFFLRNLNQFAAFILRKLR